MKANNLKIIFSGYNDKGKWEIRFNCWPEFPNDIAIAYGENEMIAIDDMNRMIKTFNLGK